MELAEIVMNPVRQRIFQYLLLHETGTVKEIRKALPDVPGASLYRHMKLLTESGILTVVGENRIRGTVESIYSLKKAPWRSTTTARRCRRRFWASAPPLPDIFPAAGPTPGGICC